MSVLSVLDFVQKIKEREQKKQMGGKGSFVTHRRYKKLTVVVPPELIW